MAGSFDILDNIDQLAPKRIGVEEFCESSDYANMALYPRQLLLLKLIFLEEMTGAEEDILTHWINGGRNGSEIVLSPNIRERREYLQTHGYKHFSEIQLVVGRRASKGFITGLAMAYKMFTTLQLGNPGDYYGIDPKKEIYFSCIAGSEAQAKKFQYSDMVARIESNKAFEPYIAESLETEIRIMTPADIREISAARARGSVIKRDQARIRGNALAANAGTLRGSATMMLALDEAAHMIAGESKSSAKEVYNAALPSLAQFARDGMMFVNSSPFSKVGMFHDLYELNLMPFDPHRPVVAVSEELAEDGDIFGNAEAQANGNPRRMVFQGPSWALFENYRYYKSKYKTRERGRMWSKMPTVSPDWIPEETDDQGRPMYSDEERELIVQARAEEAADPETYKVERRGQFAEVMEAWLNPFMVDRMYQGRPIGLVPQPNGDVIMGYEPIYINKGVGVAVNQFRYKFHLDPSSTTAGFGFAIGHIEYLPDIISGAETEHLIFDLIKRWIPSKQQGGVIRWKPILDEVVMYAKIFNPFEITMDQHQTAAPLQELQERLNKENISCQVYMRPSSAELNWKKCEVFKTALYQGLVHAPCDEEAQGVPPYTSKEELKFLQQIQSSGKYPRVDRQTLGPVQTKDMCLHPDHEVLTIDGWKPIADVTIDDKVATRSPEGVLDYHYPQLTHCREVDEQLYYYNSSHIALAVTGNHELLIVEDGHTIKRRIDEIGDSVQIPALSRVDRDVCDNDCIPEPFTTATANDFAYFTGFWLNSFRELKEDNRVCWSVVNDQAIDNIEALMARVNVPFTSVRKGWEQRYTINSTSLYQYLHKVVAKDGSRVPEDAFTKWDANMALAFCQGVLAAQNDFDLSSPRVLGSVSYLFMEDMQRLMGHLGYRMGPILHNGKNAHAHTNGGSHSMVVGDTRDTHTLLRDQIIRENYTGNVYCLTMPWGNFLTRYNGVVNWIGNCDAIIDVTWALLGNMQLQTMRERLASSGFAGGSPGGYGLGQRHYPNGSPMPLSTDGSYLYSPHSRERARGNAQTNPARGAIGNLRKGGSRISSRGRF